MTSALYKRLMFHTPGALARENFIHVTCLGHYVHREDNPPFYRDQYPGYQFCYTVAGRGWLDYKGSRHVFCPGSVGCIDLGTRHGYGPMPDEVWDMYWFVCDGRMMDVLYDTVLAERPLYLLWDPVSTGVWFQEMFRLKECDTLTFDLDAMALILQIIRRLLLHASAHTQDAGCFRPVLTYIQNHYMEDIHMEELARQAGYSTHHFSRLFKQQCGCPPSEYLAKTRIEKAKYLLTETELPLELIAQKTGFSSAGYLIRVFGKWEGITPDPYRKIPTY